MEKCKQYTQLCRNKKYFEMQLSSLDGKNCKHFKYLNKYLNNAWVYYWTINNIMYLETLPLQIDVTVSVITDN